LLQQARFRTSHHGILCLGLNHATAATTTKQQQIIIIINNNNLL
jgi:hypothetical protein